MTIIIMMIMISMMTIINMMIMMMAMMVMIMMVMIMMMMTSGSAYRTRYVDYFTNKYDLIYILHSSFVTVFFQKTPSMGGMCQ